MLRLSSKFFVLLALFLTLLGCRGNSSSDTNVPPEIGHAYFLKNAGGDVAVTNLLGSETYAQTSVSDGSDGLKKSQWKVDLTEPQPEELVVIKVTGGEDISGKSLAVSEDSEVFAVASAEDVRNGINVSPLSDLVWRISRAYVQRSERSDSVNYLNYLAGLFLKEDLNGDGVVTHRDVLDFNPNNPQHTARLAFDFSTACCDTQTYVGLVLSGVSSDEIDMEIKNLFGGNVSLAQDETISSHAGITMVGFGAGYVLDENGERVYDPGQIKTRFHVSKSRSDSYYLTAYPDSGSKILGWNGCDKVSADGTRCELKSFLRDRVVEINFGYTEVAISANYVGLGEGLTGQISPDRITVDLPSDVTLKNRLMNLSSGDQVSLVVNDQSLLVSVQYVINHGNSVEFGYQQAKLTDVIEKGTGTFSKAFSADDIESIEYPANAASQPVNVQPYKLLVQPSSSSDQSVISLSVEPAETDRKSTLEDSGTWEVDGQLLEISGSIDVKFELDLSASYEFGEGLKFFKVSPSISNEANITLGASGSLKTQKDASGNDVIRRKLGRINFARTSFLIGFVPVYLNPYVDVFLGANGEVTGQLGLTSNLTSSVFAGIYYSKEAGFEYSSGYSSDWSPGEPVVESQASFRMYVGAQPTVQIYDLMGPAIDIQGYSEMRSSYDLTSSCSESLIYGIYAGLENVLKWEATGGAKFFEVVGIKPADLQVKFGPKESKIFENKLNMCGPAPAAMLVNGSGISEIIEEGGSENIARTISIKNVGGQSLTWRADYQTDSYLMVYPDGGELEPGETQTLSMTFNNQGSREVREYRNVVQISQIGSTSPGAVMPFRRIDVNVVPKKISPPEIVQAFRKSDDPTTADIEWSIEPTDEPFIQRFDAYLTDDPVLAQQDENTHENDAWEKLAEFGRTQRKVTVSGLSDERVFLSIQAIGTKGQVVQAKTYELKEEVDHGLVVRTSSGATFLTHDGSWNTTSTENETFGNIDWKGHYIGDTPTKILSWNGPASRYFGEAGFSSEIYQGGKLFSVAPGDVHGAAIIEDGVGDKWLVTMVNEAYTDTLYIRPNSPSASPGAYDPETNPDGWRKLMSRPQTGEISGGWFFSPDGKEARAIRLEEGTYSEFGEQFNVVFAVIKELTISTETGVKGITGQSMEAISQAHSENGIIAVDYDAIGRLDLTLSNSNWLDLRGEPVIPNSELNLECFSKEESSCLYTIAQTTSFGAHGIFVGSYGLDYGTRFVNIHYLDLRERLSAYSVGTMDSGEIEGNYRALHDKTRVANTPLEELPGWAPTNTYQNYASTESNRLDIFRARENYRGYSRIAPEPPQGAWATGPNGEILFSQKPQPVYPPSQILNFINLNGDLSDLLGVRVDQGAFNVGVK